MKKAKKLIIVLFCAIMCLNIFAVTSSAATNTKPYKKSSIYRLNADGKYELMSTSKLTYKNNGRISQITTTRNNHTSKTVYKDTKTQFYEDGKLTSTVTFTKKNGRNVKSVKKDAAGKIISTTTYTYNKKGEVIKQVTKADDSEEISLYTYNKKGQTIKEVSTTTYKNGNTLTYVHETKYYSSGKLKGRESSNVTTTTSSRDGFTNTNSTTSKFTYKFNKNGSLQERIQNSVYSYGDSYTLKYVYKY